MAVTLPRPSPAAPGPAVQAAPAYGTLPAYRGFVSWLTTVDHKRIGLLYGCTAFAFFLLGGVEALMIRIQLATPNGTFVSPDAFNQLFTMHGTTMIFLFVMPMSVAFFNYVVPLQIGAPDVAFPRLNAFSYWTFLFGGIFINASYFVDGLPDGGWFGYVPLTGPIYSPSHGIDFWILGLQILGGASLAGGFNFPVPSVNSLPPQSPPLR